ncbi:MAG: hypothetical protein GEV00_23030 [Actinophytocola sp.]|nr:hypothetical protein [Actinophytocola sp.]
MTRVARPTWTCQLYPPRIENPRPWPPPVGRHRPHAERTHVRELTDQITPPRRAATWVHTTGYALLFVGALLIMIGAVR